MRKTDATTLSTLPNGFRLHLVLYVDGRQCLQQFRCTIKNFRARYSWWGIFIECSFYCCLILVQFVSMHRPAWSPDSSLVGWLCVSWACSLGFVHALLPPSCFPQKPGSQADHMLPESLHPSKIHPSFSSSSWRCPVLPCCLLVSGCGTEFQCLP